VGRPLIVTSITDDTTFGGNPVNTGTSNAWSFTYGISTTDNGDVTITFTATDNVGNTGTVQYTFYEDSIDISSEVETSPFLYAAYGSSNQGVYGSGMESTQIFTISGTASDTLAAVASITDDTTFGGDPVNTGTSSAWSFAYGVSTADNGDVTITFTATDNVGNTDTVQYTFYEDNDVPSIDITSEVETSPFLYAEYGSPYQGVYGSGMESMQSFTISGSASDALADVVSITDDTTFGGDPTNTATLSAWLFEYRIGTEDNGDLTITFTATDNVGNTGTVQYTFIEDNAAPSVDITLESESSSFLYAEFGTNYQGLYGSNMENPQTFTINGSASDALATVVSIADNTTFGGDPINSGTLNNWVFIYNIDTGDNGDVTIAFTATDNVGNTGTVQYTFIEDNVIPSINITSEVETSPFLYAAYGSLYQGLYGSSMGSTQSFTISGSSSDALADVVSITDDTTFGGDPANTGTLSAWIFIYNIDTGDNGDVTITFTATDNVGNIATIQYTFFEDNTLPSVSITGIQDQSTVNGTFNITAGASDNFGIVSVEFEVDNVSVYFDTLEPYTWSWDTTTVSYGAHNMSIHIVDLAGNVNTKIFNVTVIDATAPNVNSPTNFSYEEGIGDNTIIWVATDNYEYEYTLYKDNLLVRSSSWFSGENIAINVDDLVEGTYNYTIVFFDTFGNFVVDTVIVTVLIPVCIWPSDLVNLNGALTNISTWNWIPLETNALQMELWLNGTYKGSQSGNIDYKITLSEGTNNVTIIAYFDLQQNITREMVFITKLDSIPPEINLVSLQEGDVLHSLTSIKIEVIGHEEPIYYYWDTKPYQAASNLTFKLPSPDGSHTLYVKAVDKADNMKTESFTFTTDDTPPEIVRIIGIMDGQEVSQTVNAEVVANDANKIERVDFELAGSIVETDSDEPYVWIWDTMSVDNGNYIIRVIVYDEVGNKKTSDEIEVIVYNPPESTGQPEDDRIPIEVLQLLAASIPIVFSGIAFIFRNVIISKYTMMKHGEIIDRFKKYNLTPQEIAEETGMDIEAVKKILRRAGLIKGS
jgi:hypothetical protein